MLSPTRIDPQLLNSRQAAKWLGVCERTLWSLRDSGEIPFCRIKRAVKFDVDDLRRFVDRHKLGGTDDE